MHCDACQSLIKMELDDAGLAGVIDGIRQEGDNEGAIDLNEGVSQEDTKKIIEIINSMENYSVL